MTTRSKHTRLNYVCFNFAEMLIPSCGIILIFFSRSLYLVVIAYGMADAGVLIVSPLGDGAVTLGTTLGGEGVSTIGGSGSHKLCSGDVCTGETCCRYRIYSKYVV